MKDYVADEWSQILKSNKLGDFDSIWDLDAGWFEEPNKRRGGWSGVSKVSLNTEGAGAINVFLKRQENHNTRTLTHPFKGEPTFYREFKNIFHFINNEIPTVEPVYFAYRTVNGKSQAILMTKELEGFASLDTDIYARDGVLMQNKTQREQMMTAVADGLRKMHKHRFQHNCLYDKHVFVRNVENVWEVKFIDLEKLSRRFFCKSAMIRDLYTLTRHISGWRRNDRLKFLKIYKQEDKLSSPSKLIWNEIHNKMKAKNKVLDV